MRTDRRWTWRLRTAGVVLGAIVAWLLVAPPAGAAPQADAGAPSVQSVYLGMTVCISSSVGGYRCGTVTALNQTVCYPQGCMYGLARTNIMPMPGDSGAPVYDNRGRVVGTVVGGGGGSTWFDPI